MEDNYTPSMIAEAKVVSDAIADPSSIIDTVKVVRPYMFRYPYFNELWEQILKAWREHTTIDETMVLRIKDKDAKWLITSYLGKSGVLETVNNAYALRDSYIAEIALKQSLDLRKLAVDGISDSQKIMQSARTFVERLEGCYAENNSRNIDEAIEDLGEVLTQIREKRIEGKRPYIPTGFLFLDNYFKGGMHSGNVMVLAGRPGVGKTSVLLYMMQHMAAEGVAVKFYSCEMTIPELTEKVMYNLGGLRPYMMSSGEPDEHKWREAKAICKGWKFSIVNGMNNIHDIIADATILNQQGKCDIIFIDHLRLLQTGDSRLDANAYARTCEITRTIKKFSMLTGIPVVYVCQLNRESLKEDRDPGLQDLRDSGSIEEDADKVVFLKRKKIAEGDFQIKLIIGKHRQGAGTDEHIFLNPNDSYSGFTESEVDRSRDIDLTAEVIRR